MLLLKIFQHCSLKLWKDWNNSLPLLSQKLKKDLPTNKALEALLAKQATLLEEQDSQEKILCKDPEYAKYFKMLKLGFPRVSVIEALEQD